MEDRAIPQDWHAKAKYRIQEIMRLRFDEKLGWQAIADRLGYSDPSGAWRAIRRSGLVDWETMRCKNATGYRGVYKNSYSTWRAIIGRRYLGSYQTPEDAAKAYDAEYIQLHDASNQLNFPQDISKG